MNGDQRSDFVSIETIRIDGAAAVRDMTTSAGPAVTEECAFVDHSFQPAMTLKSRTFVGLMLAQFLAAFNDQATHIVAIFYAGDMWVRYANLGNIDEKAVISIVTACFISPFFLFSPLAGQLADKYDKRRTLVFWKAAEVLIMGLALIGFSMPHLPTSVTSVLGDPRTVAIWSAGLVVAAVFLMGTHSAFFIPAKYGIMPEVLHPSILSAGNGMLEGTSFVANILGTACGGFLYGMLKSSIDASDQLVLGHEYLIGLLLTLLAIAGASATVLLESVPAADPNLPLTWKVWKPLRRNLGMLVSSRSLTLAVFGIAFFTFMTLFLRQTLLYEGETGKELQKATEWKATLERQQQAALAKLRQAPEAEETPNDAGPTGQSLGEFVPQASDTQKAELRVAMLIAMVGLGVGIGSYLAGRLSGHKVELGLVPIGAFFLVAFTIALAISIQRVKPTVACLVAVGVAGGIYIVPLYTLLQHRAPRDSKGNLVATSNFVNVAGGLLALVAFYFVTGGIEWVQSLHITEHDVRRQPMMIDHYIHQLETQLRVPRVLFLTASVFTVAMMVLLGRMLPDIYMRTVLWLRSHGSYRLHVSGIANIPSSGPVVLATDGDRFEAAMHVISVLDRYTRFLLIESGPEDWKWRPLVRYLASRSGLVTLRADSPSIAWADAIRKGRETLLQGDIVAVTAIGERLTGEATELLRNLSRTPGALIVPIACRLDEPMARRIRHATIVIGTPLPSGTPVEEIRSAVRDLDNHHEQTLSDSVYPERSA